MFCFKQNSRLLVRSLTLSNYCTIANNKQEICKLKIRFFSKILEFHKVDKTRSFLEEHDHLIKVDEKDISKSFKYLTDIGITVDDIRKQPKILCTNVSYLRNRREIFLECGTSFVNCFMLNKYQILTNQSENRLKVMGIIDKEIRLQQELADILDVTLLPYNEDASLTNVRIHILQLFFLQNYFMSSEEFDVAITKYATVKHKSYRATKEIIEILVDRLQIPKEKLKEKFYILQYDPQRIKESLTQLNKLGFTNDAISYFPRILAMDPQILHDQIMDINSRKEFKAMQFHPLILRLMMHSSKANSRLDVLNQLDKRCFSIAILTGNLDTFKRFIEHEDNKVHPKDCVAFLAKAFDQKPEDVKKEISRHPFYCHIPFDEMKQTIDMLLDAKFELSDIYSNIHLVLYSGELILKRLDKLKQTQLVDGHNAEDLPKSLQLTLVLYNIECDFHFTGNGVWVDRKSNFVNLK